MFPDEFQLGGFGLYSAVNDLQQTAAAPAPLPPHRQATAPTPALRPLLYSTVAQRMNPETVRQQPWEAPTIQWAASRPREAPTFNRAVTRPRHAAQPEEPLNRTIQIGPFHCSVPVSAIEQGIINPNTPTETPDWPLAPTVRFDGPWTHIVQWAN